MNKKMQQLVDRAKALKVLAEELESKAVAENRDLNEAERHQADAISAEAKSISAQFFAAKADFDMREQLDALGGGTEGPGGTFLPAGSRATAKARPMHPKVKAAGGSDWADSLVRSTSGPDGYKGILASGTVAVNVPLDPGVVREDLPVLSLRQLIPSQANSTGRFSYLRQTVRTNNAAVVAPGAKKPTSIYTIGRVDGRTSTIAHLSEPIAKQDLDDVELLRPFIDQEMRLGLELGLEGEIMNGDGTGEHFTGIGNVSGSQSQAYTTDLLTTARKAVTKLERHGYLAGAGWLMTPDDWETFELLQDNEARFYYGGPIAAVNASSRRLWGVPVVTSDAATTGTAYLADFSQMTLQVRQDGVLDWSENMYDPNALGTGVGASDFERNMIRFRFEGRFGLEIKRPSSIVEVDLTA